MSLDQATPDQWMAGASAVERDWDALYADQLPRIYNYFRFRVGTDADAEDLTAHTFERAWRARERYRQDLAGFSTWLFAIAHNVAADFLRARRPRFRSMPRRSSPRRERPKRMSSSIQT